MALAVSTVVTVLFVVVIVVLGLLVAPVFRRTGHAAEKTTPRGSGVPKLPDHEFQRPRDEGG